MRLLTFFDGYRGMTKERNVTRLLTIGLIGVCLVLSFALMNKKPIVILVPQNLDGQGVIANNTASAKIKEAWALTAANLVGNVSPGNVNFIENALEGLLAPSLYHEMLEDIHAQAQSIRDGNISLTFVPAGVYFQASKNLVFVMGDTTITSRFGKPERSKKTFEFLIEVENYRPRIVNWKTYKGGPRINYNQQQESQEDFQASSDLESIAASSEEVEKQSSVSVGQEPQEETLDIQQIQYATQRAETTEAIVEDKLKEIL